ncbi:hypothetical protein V6Z11_A13G056300 [Gossypium hirsutum]
MKTFLMKGLSTPSFSSILHFISVLVFPVPIGIWHNQEPHQIVPCICW